MNIDEFLIDSSNQPEMGWIKITDYLDQELNFDEVTLENIDCRMKTSEKTGNEYQSSETELGFISYSEAAKMSFRLNYFSNYNPKTNVLSTGYRDALARVLNGIDPDKQWFKFEVGKIQELLSHIKSISLIPRAYENNGYTNYTVEVTGIELE